MAPTTGAEDRMRGRAKQTKGRIKEAAGKATGNRSLQGKGVLDKAKGKLTETKGRAKQAVARKKPIA